MFQTAKNKLNNKLKASVFYANLIRSLEKILDELKQIIIIDKNDNAIAMCLSENWLPSDFLFNLNNLSGYKLVFSESTNKSNGVANYVDATVVYEVIYVVYQAISVSLHQLFDVLIPKCNTLLYLQITIH